ncbi:MAG: hypothetical protein ACOX8G_07020 [Eubacterium sp.]|nr:hypothetical protein [Clostridium sp. SY8519]
MRVSSGEDAYPKAEYSKDDDEDSMACGNVTASRGGESRYQ